MAEFNAGDRVYYTDNGPTDIGTVTATSDHGQDVQVEWDSNPGNDPAIDCFAPGQLHHAE